MPLPAVGFCLGFERREADGPGRILLLERIGRGSSVSGAECELKMSFRSGSSWASMVPLPRRLHSGGRLKNYA
jgi:hypothetical protein